MDTVWGIEGSNPVSPLGRPANPCIHSPCTSPVMHSNTTAVFMLIPVLCRRDGSTKKAHGWKEMRVQAQRSLRCIIISDSRPSCGLFWGSLCALSRFPTPTILPHRGTSTSRHSGSTPKWQRGGQHATPTRLPPTPTRLTSTRRVQTAAGVAVAPAAVPAWLLRPITTAWLRARSQSIHAFVMNVMHKIYVSSFGAKSVCSSDSRSPTKLPLPPLLPWPRLPPC